MDNKERIIRLDRTGSTNADAAVLARAGASSGTVIVADHQTAGRGRLGRRWEAPPGTSVAMSVIWRPNVEVSRWAWLSLVTGWAVAEAIRGLTGLKAGVKWPNDVLIDDRKIAGILAELVQTPAGLACVMGIGVNTWLRADQLPVPTATSLLLAGAPVRNEDLMDAVLRQLDQAYQRWDRGDDFRPVVRERCLTIGRRVRVLLPAADQVTGLAVDLDAEGRLIVDVDGETRPFAAGDVVHLR